MKIKAIIFSLCLMNQIQTEEHNLPTKTSDLQKLTVLAQEILYLQFVLPTWLDYQKASDAIIYCNVCNRPMSSLEFYGQLTGQGNAENIARLKDLWRTETVEIINKFLAEVSNNTHIECATCLAFHGWHSNI